MLPLYHSLAERAESVCKPRGNENTCRVSADLFFAHTPWSLSQFTVHPPQLSPQLSSPSSQDWGQYQATCSRPCSAVTRAAPRHPPPHNTGAQRSHSHPADCRRVGRGAGGAARQLGAWAAGVDAAAPGGPQQEDGWQGQAGSATGEPGALCVVCVGSPVTGVCAAESGKKAAKGRRELPQVSCVGGDPFVWFLWAASDWGMWLRAAKRRQRAGGSCLR